MEDVKTIKSSLEEALEKMRDFVKEYTTSLKSLEREDVIKREKHYILSLVDLSQTGLVKVPYDLLTHCAMMQNDADIIEIFADAQADVVKTIREYKLPIKNRDIDVLLLGMYLGMFYYAYDRRFENV